MTGNQFHIDKLDREITSLRAKVDELTAALRGMVDAVCRDADDGRGISGYTSARLADARAALAVNSQHGETP